MISARDRVCILLKLPKSEDQKREDEVLRRMLNAPPTPHRPVKKIKKPLKLGYLIPLA